MTTKKKTTRKKVTRKKKSTAVSKANGSTALVPWREKLAALAKSEAARAPASGGNKISIKGKTFRYQGSDLGDVMGVVILHYAYTNNYYDRPYDEDNTSPAACAAVGLDRDELTPVANAPDVQHENCAGCWANEFQSDARGKGKACRNAVLLAVVSSDAVTGKQKTLDPDTEVALLSVPAGSIANFSGYLKKVTGASGLPVMAFTTELSFESGVDWPELNFALDDEVSEPMLEGLLALRETVEPMLLEVPDFTGYEPVKTRGRKKKVSKKKKRGGARSKFGA